MEIIFEILFSVFYFFLEIIFEILAQAVIEVLAEIGLRSLAEPFKMSRPVNPVLAGIGYLLYGAAAGGLSLLFPKLFDVPWWIRFLNLIIIPVACGYVMVKIGQIRERRGNKVIRFDTFIYGYLFALAMAVVRFIWR